MFKIAKSQPPWNVWSISQIQNGLWPFNDFTKSRRPFWNYVLEIEREPDPPSISGFADGHKVQMYASITNTEQVNSHFNDSMKSRRPYWIFLKMPLDEIVHTLRKMLS